MPRHDTHRQTLTTAMKQVSSAAGELSTQIRGLKNQGREMRRGVSQYCIGGQCFLSGGGGTSGSPRGNARSASSGGGSRSSSSSGSGNSFRLPLGGMLSGVIGSTMRGDIRGALQSVTRNVIRSIATFAARGIGGVGGSIFGTLLGGGLGLLAGKLFGKRQRVQVENKVLAEVLNFPRVSSLGFASNPASRLFGGRAVARGPAFSVSVEYKGGAEDIVAAKVATKLADINFNEGVL